MLVENVSEMQLTPSPWRKKQKNRRVPIVETILCIDSSQFPGHPHPK